VYTDFEKNMKKQKFRQFDIITIFPDTIDSYASESILGRAQKKKLIKIKAHDLRDWASDKHRTVDDTPYGGGPGMVMKVEPFEKAVKKVKKRLKKTRVIMTAASGKPFTQKDAKRLAKYDQLIFLCGRYEGIDARVEEKIADEVFSIGNYVLTGGELPALTMTDAIARMIPGVLGSKESLDMESHSKEGILEYPQYTKPEVYKNWKVPKVLLSGDHKKIAEWRSEQSKKRSQKK
jgi:tRNA (guanine37-N1)-methyltransferase